MLKTKTTWPSKLDKERILQRDTECIYCKKKMSNKKGASRKNRATVEHLNHRSDWDSVGSYIKEGKDVTEIVGICCGSCNSSRGALALSDWFKKPYCLERNINKNTVSLVVRNYLKKYE